MKSEKNFSIDTRVFCHEDTKAHKDLMHDSFSDFILSDAYFAFTVFAFS